MTIAGLGALSALGEDVASHRHSILAGEVPFRRLEELEGFDGEHGKRPAAWIRNRGLLVHRKWSPVTMASLHVARQAIEAAGWTHEDLKDAALVVGTSRGNAAGWLAPWPGRRPFRLMAASNTMHGESASAISIEFGITGPNHVIATGCAAGLDAVGVAMMLLQSGAAQRALAVAVDLPLVPALLDHYASSGILSSSLRLDPYHPKSAGFIPGEGAAAMAIESGGCSQRAQLVYFGSNSDACDPIGIPKDGGRTPELFSRMPVDCEQVHAVSPHATGTSVQAAADPASMGRVFAVHKPSLHVLKPYVGHTIGASGLLESAVLAEFLRTCELPPNLTGLYAPSGFDLPDVVTPARGYLAKLSHGMGGHNALLVMKAAAV